MCLLTGGNVTIVDDPTLISDLLLLAVNNTLEQTNQGIDLSLQIVVN